MTLDLHSRARLAANGHDPRLITRDRESASAGSGARHWPGVLVILCAGLAGALAVAVDTWFSAQAGYLARGPDYEGVGYLLFARTAYVQIGHLHITSALHVLNSITPLWTFLQTLQYFVVGDGTWQAFTIRLWPVVLLLILVYWIVRARATRAVAIAATVLTALLPMVSASVRSSSWELFSGRANYFEDWGLDDLRPDFFAAVLAMWSIASLAEHHRNSRRSSYIVSAAFAAAAVLAKPSTATFALTAWALTLFVLWLWRRDRATLRNTALAFGVLLVLLSPWAIVGRGVLATVSRLYGAAVTYNAAYSAGLNLLEKLAYYFVRLPNQIGQVEVSVVIAGSLFLAIVALRGGLDRAEVIYAGLAAFFYATLTIPANQDPNIGEYVSLSLWLFFVAAASRYAAAKWPTRVGHASAAILSVVGVFALLAYSLGAIAIAKWPDNERSSNAQLRTVTIELAQELGAHLGTGGCFSYAPGPGWPASIQYLLMDSDGKVPASTPIDVDPHTITVDDYVLSAKRCKAVIAYREQFDEVAKVFFAPAVRRPYLEAVADWVRGPASGYSLDRTWRLTDRAPRGPHRLGQYQGIDLTVDLFLRRSG